MAALAYCELHAHRSWPAQGFVAGKRDGQVVRTLRELTSEHVSVLDRHRRALREERKHGVSGVAQQRDARRAPALKRISVQQTPTENMLGLREQGLHRFVPARV